MAGRRLERDLALLAPGGAGAEVRGLRALLASRRQRRVDARHRREGTAGHLDTTDAASITQTGTKKKKGRRNTNHVALVAPLELRDQRVWINKLLHVRRPLSFFSSYALAGGV